jgi:hypothetical protein
MNDQKEREGTATALCIDDNWVLRFAFGIGVSDTKQEVNIHLGRFYFSDYKNKGLDSDLQS